MQAPPSRYRVIERKGRLEVVDTWAGHRPEPAHVPLEPVTAALEPGAPQRDAAPDAPPDRTAYAPPGFLQMVATTLCSEARDDQGRLILTTMPVYDGKAPRDIPLDAAGQREIGQAALILLAVAVSAVIFVVLVGWFGFVMLFIVAAFSSIAKTISTAWLDRLEARSR